MRDLLAGTSEGQGQLDVDGHPVAAGDGALALLFRAGGCSGQLLKAIKRNKHGVSETMSNDR